MSTATEFPQISVLIPAFNCERHLRAAIESVLAQTLPPMEIVVVDDGSTDRTLEVAQSFGAKVRCECRAHAGISETRNACLALARGNWIAFLDADDLWLPDKLAEQTSFMLARPHLQYTLTHVRLFLESGCSMQRGYLPEWFEHGQQCSWLSAFLGRKGVFDRVGGFDPGFEVCEDVDWFARAQALGMTMAHLQRELLLKRVHDRNISNRVETNKAFLLQAVRRQLDRKAHA